MKNLLLISLFFFIATGSISAQDANPLKIAVNQLGYFAEGPKRFTAPELADGTEFILRYSDEKKALYKGKIQGGIGDFSSFMPLKKGRSYVIEAKKPQSQSFDFYISSSLQEKHLWQLAVDYMVDCRSVTGTHPSAYGGNPWRDGTYYSYEVPSLIWLFRANPEFFIQAPRQIDYKDDKARVLSDAFVYDDNNPQSEDVMQAVKRYFKELEAPADNAPDILKMVHWGLGYYLMKPYSKDPSRDPLPKQIHSQTVEQFSHLLYAWEELKLNRWLPQSFYDRCLSFVLTHWKAQGSLDIDPWWRTKSYKYPVKENGRWMLDNGELHPYKGRHVPGHSILPNLYMYKVLQEKYPEMAPGFLEAAIKQSQWIIDSLDWNLPATTKGHRGSEFQTITNLVWFLENLPEHAPQGLQAKIESWADVVIQRAQNMWDFRRYDLDEHWSLPLMNEPGNLAAFPACALSASWVLKGDEKRHRLEEIAYAHFDNLMGRNPVFSAVCNRPQNGWPFIERGWPKSYYEDVCARLETVRGSIDASPGTEMYPFNPNGEMRHPEGWINWNACWNVGLAFFEMHKKRKKP